MFISKFDQTENEKELNVKRNFKSVGLQIQVSIVSFVNQKLIVFMHDLFIKGAFQGTVSKKAYFVKCDGETTTQQDIDKGIVNVIVGFAPLKSAEFVILKIIQHTVQAEGVS